MSDPKEEAVKGVNGVLEALKQGGLEVHLSAEQIELVGEGLVAFIGVLSGAALKKAAAAGAAAAAAVTTVEEANAVLKAAAAAEEVK